MVPLVLSVCDFGLFIFKSCYFYFLFLFSHLLSPSDNIYYVFGWIFTLLRHAQLFERQIIICLPFSPNSHSKSLSKEVTCWACTENSSENSPFITNWTNSEIKSKYKVKIVGFENIETKIEV